MSGCNEAWCEVKKDYYEWNSVLMKLVQSLSLKLTAALLWTNELQQRRNAPCWWSVCADQLFVCELWRLASFLPARIWRRPAWSLYAQSAWWSRHTVLSGRHRASRQWRYAPCLLRRLHRKQEVISQPTGNEMSSLMSVCLTAHSVSSN